MFHALKKPIYFFIVIAIISLFVAPIFSIAKAESDSNFHITLLTEYTVNERGDASVVHTFTIENLTPTYFINKYGLQLSSDSIQDISVQDNGEEIPAEIVTTDTITSIGITFPDKILGEHKKRIFKISYSNPDIAQVSGNVLEITVPQLADHQKYDDYSVAVYTPISFGEPSRVSPQNYTFQQEGDFFKLFFAQPSGRGISSIYGYEQTFNLDLTYHLENPNTQPVLTQISLPPDTAYQKMNYNHLDPLPKNIERDPDGNWIATYQLPSNTTTTVLAQAQAVITLEPNTEVPSSDPDPIYTKEKEFWEYSEPIVLGAASQAQTPESIYLYTVNNLNYTEEDISQNLVRLGVIGALENPDLATCQEFTDTFIALARANSIHSRRITGYALTNDSSLRPLSLVSDILHAWPEYYNQEKKAWIPIDPTWGNTTKGVDYFNQFDLNHIVFAINGESSTLPHPAGAYRLMDDEGKNITVTIAQEKQAIQPNFELTLVPQTMGPVTIPGSYMLTLTNLSGSAWYDLNLIIQTLQDSLVSIHTESQAIESILPFQSIEIPISVHSKEGIAPTTDRMHIVLEKGDKTYVEIEGNVKTSPKQLSAINQPSFGIAVVIGCILVTLFAGSVLILRRKK